MGKAILPTLDPIRNYSGIMKHKKPTKPLSKRNAILFGMIWKK
jgi:hypothetical protein